MKSNSAAIACLVAGTFLNLGALRGASDYTWDRVTLGGFFSQGYLYSSNNNYPATDKGGTWDFREMAVSASTTVGAHLRVGAQAFAQRLGELGEDKVLLDWAVADYNFRPEFGLRVGRVKYPKGIYGEALDLDLVRPFAFLPGAVYSPVLRDFSASFDGVMAYGSIDAGKSSFDYKIFRGDIPMSAKKGVAEFYNNAGLYDGTGVATLGMDAVTGGQLVWNTPLRGLKIAYSHSFYTNLQTDGPFAAYAPVNLHSNFDRFTFQTYSAEYVRDNWTFAGEWQRCSGAIAYAALPLLPTVHDHSGWDGWYVSAARRIGPRFELGTYYSYLTNRYSSSPRSDSRNHQRDVAISVRCDLSEHVLVKLEAQFIEGTYQTFNTARIPNPSAALRDSTTVIAAKTTFSF